MRFGPVPLAEAVGAIAAHSIRAGGAVVKKGTVVSVADVEALAAAGLREIVVARLDPDDVPEDEAARALAARIGGPNVRVDDAFTGRANLYATEAGVLVVDRDGIEALNRVDESITFATLPAFAVVEPGEMIATVKIIPFAVPAEAQRAALDLLAGQPPLVRVAPFVRRRVGIVSTVLPGLADKVIEKTLRVTAERLKPMGATIVDERRVPHDTAVLTQAVRESLATGADAVIVFGASAIADRRDVIPASIERAGGRVLHFGMPVDPGNLMLIGDIGGVPVLGAPGCARSPKENGFDWVLARLLAGLPVGREDVTAMGVGGLLMEIVTRPQLRAEPPPAEKVPAVAAIVLAAGRSTRMGGPNKLLQPVGGKPLVRHAVEAALASRARPVIVVTGHQGEAVRAALAGLPVTFVDNPDFASGLSTSVRAGISAVPPEADAALVMLGDMPRVNAALIDRLIAAFEPSAGRLVACPVTDGQRGNPVLWARRFFPELRAIEGDQGARALLPRIAEAVVEVPVEGDAALLDVDTPEALAAL